MSKRERCKQPALGAVDEYEEMQPVLRHIRVMDAVMNAVGEHPKMRDFHAELHGIYMGILSREIAEHALQLALAITQLEDAYPEIGRAPDVQVEQPYLPILVLRDSASDERIAVNLMWVRSMREAGGGTRITFTDGAVETVGESLDLVLSAANSNTPPPRRQRKGSR